MRSDPFRRAMVLGLLGALAAGWSPAVALGQQGVLVQGEVINGTLDEAPVSGATVVLHSNGPTGHEDVETLTGGDGNFRFDVFTPKAVATYGVSVRYQGALYGNDIDVSEAPRPVILRVFEATDDEALLTVSSASLLIGGVDRQSRLLEALEIATVVNSSDRAYVPGPEPMKLLRFGLPPGATGLQVDTALPGADVIQVDRGFAVAASVPPGEHQVLFRYFVPYTGDVATISKSFPYGGEAVRVVVPEELELFSPVLGAAEPITIGSRRYRLLEASSIERGAVIPIEIKNLPEPNLWDNISGRVGGVRFEYVGPLGLAAFTLVILIFAMRQKPGGWRLGRLRNSGQAEVLQLLDAVAALDARFNDGLIDGNRYEGERARLRNRLLILHDTLSAQPGEGVRDAEEAGATGRHSVQ